MLDLELHLHLDGWLDSLTQVVATVILISIEIPMFLIVVLPMGLIYYLLQVMMGCGGSSKKKGRLLITPAFRSNASRISLKIRKSNGRESNILSIYLSTDSLHRLCAAVPSFAVDYAVPSAEQLLGNHQWSFYHKSLWRGRVLHRKVRDKIGSQSKLLLALHYYIEVCPSSVTLVLKAL